MSNDDLPTAHDTSGDGLSGQYFNRELSWLEFNRRVLEEAMDQRHPLLERVKFLAIFSSNLDEFFMIRVAGIRQQIAAGVTSRTADGLLPGEQLAAIRHGVAPLIAQQRACWSDDIQPRLRREGIFVLDYDELDQQQRQACRDYFTREVFPVLTPLAFDPAHPFPHISNLSLNLAVVIRDPEPSERTHDITVRGPAGPARQVRIEEILRVALGLEAGPDLLRRHPASHHALTQLIRDIGARLQHRLGL